MVFSPNGIRLHDLAKIPGVDPHQIWPTNPILLIKSTTSDSDAPFLHMTPHGSKMLGATINVLGSKAIAGYIAPGAMVVPVIKSRRNDKDGVIVVGRSAEADIRMSDNSLSREHAHLFPPKAMADAWKISDAGSTNGSFVNGIQIGSGRMTYLGFTEEIKFGLVRALFLDTTGLCSILEHAVEAWNLQLEEQPGSVSDTQHIYRGWTADKNQ